MGKIIEMGHSLLSDFSTSYVYDFVGAVTVKEFIDELAEDNKDTHLTVIKLGDHMREEFRGFLKQTSSHNDCSTTMKTPIPDNLANKQVIRACSNGGFGRWYYTVWI